MAAIERETKATGETAVSTKTTGGVRSTSVVQRRYQDGYRVASTINGFGQTIKVGGCVLGVLIVIVVAASGMSGSGAASGLLLAFMIAAIFFVIGVIVAAQGQLLKATLDTAVHTSPFLTDGLKAGIMSLGSIDQGESLQDGGNAP